MCGIVACIGDAKVNEVMLQAALLGHRGPDATGVFCARNGSVVVHKRLSIMDVEGGNQPLLLGRDTALVHNGEIYNHEAIFSEFLGGAATRKTGSDSEAILHLYEAWGERCVDQLDGVFAFVILDGERFFAARDPIGVKPLFYGFDDAGRFWMASEAKALAGIIDQVEEFPPGHFCRRPGEFERYYDPAWLTGPYSSQDIEAQLRQSLERAIAKRLMGDVPVAVLLSGGLDSSLIAAIASKHCRGELHSWSIGIDEHADDLVFARAAARRIGTIHHEVHFSLEEAFEAVEKVIYHLETYNISTIRGGTPMYLLSQRIRASGAKVVLSGEGADELFGGYLFFYNSPSVDAFNAETIRRVFNLYKADVLRVDRVTMAHGLELRVPFLDKALMDLVFSIAPSEKIPLRANDRHPGRMEKYILRKAFSEDPSVRLPQEVLWRQKEQFSDGVGYRWVDSLKHFTESQVSDEEFAEARARFPFNTPESKEGLFYRRIYERLFPNPSLPRLVRITVPVWQDSRDPSGRSNAAHQDALAAHRLELSHA